MWLPIPSDRAVAAFVRLAKNELDLDIPPEEAREAATQVLHMYVLRKLYPEGLRMPEGPTVRPMEEADAEPPKRKRGRPRKNPVVEFAPRPERLG